MKYDSNYLQALGECLRACSTYDLAPRDIARLMLDLVADSSGGAQMPVGFLDLPEAPMDADDGDDGEPQDRRDDRGRKVVLRDRQWRPRTLEAMEQGPATLAVLAQRLAITENSLRLRLGHLVREGKAVREGDQWSLA